MANYKEYNTPHELDYYKKIYEQYELRVDEKNDYIGAIDRKTGKEVEPEAKNNILCLDLMFAQSWIDACKNSIPYNGKINEYGVEVKQWEYSFNDGAQDTYSWLLGLIKYCADNNKSMKVKDMARIVREKSTYKYADEIVEYLLGASYSFNTETSPVFNEYSLKNVKKTLLTNAGINSNKSEEVFKDR